MTDPSSTPLPPAEGVQPSRRCTDGSRACSYAAILDQMLDSPALLIATAAFDTIEEKSSPKQSPALLVATRRLPIRSKRRRTLGGTPRRLSARPPPEAVA